MRLPFSHWKKTSRGSVYFGHCESDGSTPAAWSNTYDFHSGKTWYGFAGTQDFICPGTGPQVVNLAGVFARTRGAPHSNVRMAIYTYDIYDPTLVKVCEWDAPILVNAVTGQWWDHASFTGTPTLIGGRHYRIAASCASALFSYAYLSITNATKEIAAADYTAGFPDPIGAGSSTSTCLLMRVSITGDRTPYLPTVREDYYIDTDYAGGGSTGSPTKPYINLQTAMAARCNKTFTLPIFLHCRGTTADTIRVTDDALGQMVPSVGKGLFIVTDADHRAGPVWSTSKYRLEPAFIPGSGAGTAFDMNHGYVYIDGLQIGISSIAGQSGEAAELLYLAQASTGYVANCHIKGSNVANSGANNILRGVSSIHGINFYNTIIDIRTSHTGNQAVKNHAASYFYNCTIMSGAGTGVDVADNSSVTVKNCYLQGDTASYLVTATASTLPQTTTATSDALSDDVGLRNVAVNTTNFANVTANTEDWNIPAGSALEGAGTDTSGDASPFNFNTDINGFQRTAPWDIGAVKA